MLIHNDLDNLFSSIAAILTADNRKEIQRYLKDIITNAKLNLISTNNRSIQTGNPDRTHPTKIYSGEIYYITMTDGVGTELKGDHLGVVIQNTKANLYSSKVNIVPIEGDGSKINKNYNVELTNADLVEGHIDKDPSRIITTDILTLDKCRLGKKIGKVTPEKLVEIRRYVRKQLDI